MKKEHLNLINELKNNKIEDNEIRVEIKDLTEEEIEQCIESWYYFRETEEERGRNEVNEFYNEPMPKPDEVREILAHCCTLYKNLETGYIFVNL